ncbi:hypothetical protein F5Y16DRAFT_397416 [Xylariaceae sp. FL0255]|nr:hypothetical protein F5Y16DRAFT_397416 [Xylariaceae sp. FL0255]
MNHKRRRLSVSTQATTVSSIDPLQLPGTPPFHNPCLLLLQGGPRDREREALRQEMAGRVDRDIFDDAVLKFLQSKELSGTREREAWIKQASIFDLRAVNFELRSETAMSIVEREQIAIDHAIDQDEWENDRKLALSKYGLIFPKRDLSQPGLEFFQRLDLKERMNIDHADRKIIRLDEEEVELRAENERLRAEKERREKEAVAEAEAKKKRKMIDDGRAIATSMITSLDELESKLKGKELEGRDLQSLKAEICQSMKQAIEGLQ